MKQVIYDDSKDRLVWFQKKGARPTFWDQHWTFQNNFSNDWIERNRPHLTELLVKILSRGRKARIIEAGCGRGQIVYHLTQRGYHIEGIDTAQKTIEMIKKNYPELNVRVEDARTIEKLDSYYDIYISLGVIEHFEEDPTEILDEMWRVTKTTGYIILAVPSINLLRRIKIRLNKYDTLPETAGELDDFYQYAFSVGELKRMFRDSGLKIAFTFPWSGIKGLKDEVGFLRAGLERMGSIKTRSALGLIAKRSFDMFLATFAAHMRFFILQPQK